MIYAHVPNSSVTIEEEPLTAAKKPSQRTLYKNTGIPLGSYTKAIVAAMKLQEEITKMSLSIPEMASLYVDVGVVKEAIDHLVETKLLEKRDERKSS